MCAVLAARLDEAQQQESEAIAKAKLAELTKGR